MGVANILRITLERISIGTPPAHNRTVRCRQVHRGTRHDVTLHSNSSQHNGLPLFTNQHATHIHTQAQHTQTQEVYLPSISFAFSHCNLHVQKVFRIIEITARVDNGLAKMRFVRHRRNSGHLSHLLKRVLEYNQIKSNQIKSNQIKSKGRRKGKVTRGGNLLIIIIIGHHHYHRSSVIIIHFRLQ